MVDYVIGARDESCSKVTVVGHGTGANAALVAAQGLESFETKVGRIVAMAPCMAVNQDEMWMVGHDLPTIQLMYEHLETFGGFTHFFGASHEDDLADFCNMDNYE